MERRIDSGGSFCLFTQHINRNMKWLQYHDVLLKRPTEEEVSRWRSLYDKNMKCSVKCGLVLTFNLLPQLLYIINHTYSWTKDPLLHRHCDYFGSTTQLKPTNTACQHKQNVLRGHVNINRIIFLETTAHAKHAPFVLFVHYSNLPLTFFYTFTKCTDCFCIYSWENLTPSAVTHTMTSPSLQIY